MLYSRTDQVLFQVLDGEAVLYDTEHERYFSLNETGTDLWNFLEEPSTRESLVEKMYELYEVEKDILGPDCDEVMAALSQAGLVNVLED